MYALYSSMLHAECVTYSNLLEVLRTGLLMGISQLISQLITQLISQLIYGNSCAGRPVSEDQGSVPVSHGDDWQNTRALRDVFWGQDK